MSTITIWILLAVSVGGYNSGTVTVVDRFATAADCGSFVADIMAQPKSYAARAVEYRCVQAKVVR